MQFAIPLLTALLVSLWALISIQVIFKPFQRKKKDKRKKFDLIEYLGLETIEEEAQRAGWNITKKEFLYLIGFAVLVAIILALATRNPFILVAGFVAGYYLPRYLLEKHKRNQKEALLKALPDPLRMITSRLPDTESATKAIELTLQETTDPVIKEILMNYIKDIAVGANIVDALNNMKNTVNLRKFDTFIENLILSHEDGYTANAIRSLDKAIDVIEGDIRAIDTVKVQSKTKKKNLYIATGTAWFFPIILSSMHTGNENVYLSTIPGKILMFMYAVGTIYILVKSEDYLSLKLEDL